MSVQMPETFKSTAIPADIFAQEYRTPMQRAQLRFHNSIK